ncbi:interferon-inducible double-stranded RNA-dependent protein kinase activator A homolog B isoform X2 [Frankliniella occidentalis]|uniref:Interferon-inducible double-stranded RNA-dependent protein kinase activator A homolog B isoform X2 n=1 Tax=Frankliniella occidentalis TaxID=133901 RepID=A0A6J1S1V6_FRAOC|nr:interferon-inducible double-stranded RNA-dependent protein kinase activator A homolog B isoform X2 [Frankliniella occidentalis]
MTGHTASLASEGQKRPFICTETVYDEIPSKMKKDDETRMACNQTAVAVLQELCMKRRWNPPIYDTVDAGGPPNDPIFEVAVTLCNGIKGVGRGRTKKAAKHEAAKKALEQIQERALPDVNINLSPNKPPINPHEDVGGANPVGELQNLCSAKHLPAPVYDVIGDEGEPHEKLFTYKCTVSQRSAQGTARKKQTAKHLSAQNMLAMLKSDMKVILDEIPDDPAVSSLYSQKSKETTVLEKDKKRDLEALEKYKALKDSKGDIPAAPLISPGTKFSDYHLAYASQLGEFRDIIEKPGIKQERNSLKKLKLVAAELNFPLNIMSNPGKDNKRYVAFVHLATDPPTITAAQNENEITATEMAARNCLDFLSVMSTT